MPWCGLGLLWQAASLATPLQALSSHQRAPRGPSTATSPHGERQLAGKDLHGQAKEPGVGRGVQRGTAGQGCSSCVWAPAPEAAPTAHVCGEMPVSQEAGVSCGEDCHRPAEDMMPHGWRNRCENRVLEPALGEVGGGRSRWPGGDGGGDLVPTGEADGWPGLQVGVPEAWALPGEQRRGARAIAPRKHLPWRIGSQVHKGIYEHSNAY